MKVETFEVEEIKGELETMAADSESIELINKLGLEGQKQLVKPETATRMPYRLMTAEERVVYRLLCPEVSSVYAFKSEPIPLRVLQVAAHAKECDLFDDIEVWSARSQVVKDPVLVGVKKDATIYGHKDYYILARWGRELLDIEALKVLAVPKLREDITAKLNTAKKQVDAEFAKIDETIASVMAGETEIPTPHFYA